MLINFTNQVTLFIYLKSNNVTDFKEPDSLNDNSFYTIVESYPFLCITLLVVCIFTLVYIYSDSSDGSINMRQFEMDNNLKNIKISDLKGFNYLNSKDISSTSYMVEYDTLVLFTLGLLIFFLFLLENYGNRVGSSLSHKLGLDYRNRINTLLALYKTNSEFLRRILRHKAAVNIISNTKWEDRTACTVEYRPAMDRFLWVLMRNNPIYRKYALPAVKPVYDLKQLHLYNYFIYRWCSVYGSAIMRGYKITPNRDFNLKFYNEDYVKSHSPSWKKHTQTFYITDNIRYAESHRQAYKRLARVKQAVWFSYFTCNMSKNNGDSILIKHKPGFKKNVKCVKFNLKPLVKVYVKSRGVVDGDSREVSFYKILKGSGAVPWRLLGLKKTYYVYVVNRYGTYGTGP